MEHIADLDHSGYSLLSRLNPDCDIIISVLIMPRNAMFQWVIVCYCQCVRGPGINQLTMQPQHGLIVKPLESGLGKKGERRLSCVPVLYRRPGLNPWLKSTSTWRYYPCPPPARAAFSHFKRATYKHLP